MRFHNSDLGYQLEKKGHTQQQEQQETMQATPTVDATRVQPHCLGFCKCPDSRAKN